MQSPGARKAMRASSWSAVDALARQGIQFVVMLVLARLLSPSEFGLFAILSFFVTVCAAAIQSGLVMAIVRNPISGESEWTGIFWLNLAVAISFGAALAISGPFLARFFGNAQLGSLLLAAGVVVILSAFGSVHAAILMSRLEWSRLATVSLVSSVLGGLLGIVMAMHGYGVWALTTMLMVSQLATAVGSWLAISWRPSLRFKLARIGPMVRFGRWMGISAVLEVAYSQGFSIMLGKMHSLNDVGMFDRGNRTQQMATGVMSAVIGRVAMPLFAERSGDRYAIRNGMKLSIGVMMLINLPMMIGMTMTAPLLIEVLFGPQWSAAAPILSIVAMAGIFYPLHVINLQALIAVGESSSFLNLEIRKKIVAVALLLIAGPFGMIAIAWAQVIAGVYAVFVNTRYSAEMFDYPLSSQLSDLRGLIIPLAALAVATALTMYLLDGPALVKLALVSAIGCAVYVGSCTIVRSAPLMTAAGLLGYDLRLRR